MICLKEDETSESESNQELIDGKKTLKQLRKFYSDLRFKSDEISQKCDVCLDGDPEDNDQILYCDLCDFSCH